MKKLFSAEWDKGEPKNVLILTPEVDRDKKRKLCLLRRIQKKKFSCKVAVKV